MINRFSYASGRSGPDMEPVLLRLNDATACSPELVRRLEALASRVETLPAKTELQAEDRPMRHPRYLISGWACRYRHLADGRKQIFDLVLAGEGVGVCLRPHPMANTSTAALTSVRLVDASPLLDKAALQSCAELGPALQVLADADERRMLNQIMRLGRQSALERLAHVLLDLYDRLAKIGQVERDRFPLPLTQETLADLTGLSVVHVNRTLQELRRQDMVVVERGWAKLSDRAALSQMADYADPVRSAPSPPLREAMSSRAS